MESMRLRSSDFRRERQAQWRELETLVKQVEKKGIKSLEAEKLHRLPGLYRAAVSSLSVARAISLDRNMLDYLESLVSCAYFAVYGVKPQARSLIALFFQQTFPATVRRYGASVLTAIAVMMAGLAVGLTFTDSEFFYSVMRESIAEGRSPTSTTEELREILYSGGEESDSTLGYFATYLFTHNSQLGMLAFALGFALGIPSILLLFYNGLVIGALAGLYHTRGLGFEFWAWVLPHGVTELLAVCLCGGAGLAIGFAVIRPGRYGRLHGMARAGKEASLIVLGAVLMLLIAGIIEGFFRQLVQSLSIRYTLAGITFVFWTVYFLGRGREREKR